MSHLPADRYHFLSDYIQLQLIDFLGYTPAGVDHVQSLEYTIVLTI